MTCARLVSPVHTEYSNLNSFLLSENVRTFWGHPLSVGTKDLMSWDVYVLCVCALRSGRVRFINALELRHVPVFIKDSAHREGSCFFIPSGFLSCL